MPEPIDNPTRRAPPWMTRSRDAEDDAARFRAMTPDERLAVFVEAIGLSTAILRGRRDAADVLAVGRVGRGP